jgi:hypothetical protein
LRKLTTTALFLLLLGTSVLARPRHDAPQPGIFDKIIRIVRRIIPQPTDEGRPPIPDPPPPPTTT